MFRASGLVPNGLSRFGREKTYLSRTCNPLYLPNSIRFASSVSPNPIGASSPSGQKTLHNQYSDEFKQRRYGKRTILGLGVVAAVGLSIAIQQYFTQSQIHLDAPDIETFLKRASLQKRKILHSTKYDTIHGVDVEHILKRCEESFHRSGPGVWRYDINQIASNFPIEDDHDEAVMRSPTGAPWHFWAVIDGHAGWETSATLAQRLIPSVSGALRGLYSRKPTPDSEDIDQAIKGAFVTLDNEIVYEDVLKAMESGSRDFSPESFSRAMAGAVAMLTFYDPSVGTAKVALTGDLRAVRGRRGSDGKWETTTLTVEQDGDNEDEANRIRKEHPEEPDVIKNGRVLGYQPTRMFGDASLKWSVDTQKALRQKFLGPQMRDVIKTPPYVTAEPVITTTDIKEGDFLILGCDGIWECLTSQEAVGLIGSWLDEPRSAQFTSSNTSISSTSTPAGATETRSWWPLSKKRVEQASKPEKDEPIRYRQWQIQKSFVNVDDNAATHLVRNSLGSADKATMKALLTRTGNHARRLRDDMTVTIVFFGEKPVR